MRREARDEVAGGSCEVVADTEGKRLVNCSRAGRIDCICDEADRAVAGSVVSELMMG